MATISLQGERQVIDYLARDYDSFRQALLDLVPAKLPEWTDRSEAELGVMLVELVAYAADILAYYQDRMANEAFLTTAQERRSVIEHLRLIGYELAAAAPATARLTLVVANGRSGRVEIRPGDQFATRSTAQRPAITYEYVGAQPLVVDLGQLTLDSAYDENGATLHGFKEAPDAIPVREGRTILREVAGTSDGSPNQRFRLSQPGVLRDTIHIVADTTPPTAPWRRRKNLVFSARAWTPEQLATLEYQERIASTLAFSRAPDADFATETDEDEITTVVFGDGQYGRIPPPGVRILATYRAGGGSAGNVGARQITVVKSAPQLQLLGARVYNAAPASGGAERESIDHAVRFAPVAFTSMNRAVTAEDYVAQARLFPGVGKARAEATNWNTVKLYVAPTGHGEEPSDDLQRDLVAWFEDKRMLTTVVEVESPTYVSIEIRASIEVESFFRASEVRAGAEAAVRALLDFEQVDFGQTLYLSKIYEALEELEGVRSAFVGTFRRVGGPASIPADGRIVLGGNELPVLRDADLTIAAGGER